jgi:hypothetical protein
VPKLTALPSYGVPGLCPCLAAHTAFMLYKIILNAVPHGNRVSKEYPPFVLRVDCCLNYDRNILVSSSLETSLGLLH